MLIEVIEECILAIKPEADKHYDKDLSFPSKLIFFHTLERLLNNLYSLKVLSKDICLESEHAISQILRNMLSDFIIHAYVIVKSEDFTESDDLLVSLIRSDINRMDSYFNTLANIGSISQEEHEAYKANQSLNDVVTKVNDWYTKEELKRFPTNKGIVEYILSTKAMSPSSWKDDIIKAYDIWILLSKYEHIGYYSYSITRVIDIKKIKLRILETLKLMVFLSGNLLEYLDKDYDPNEILKLYQKINTISV